MLLRSHLFLHSPSQISPVEDGMKSVLPDSLHIFNAISGTPTSVTIQGVPHSASVIWSGSGLVYSLKAHVAAGTSDCSHPCFAPRSYQTTTNEALDLLLHLWWACWRFRRQHWGEAWGMDRCLCRNITTQTIFFCLIVFCVMDRSKFWWDKD